MLVCVEMTEKLRAWWWHRQGLDQPDPASAEEILSRFGWARTVGSANPYLTMWARGGPSPRDLEFEVTQGDIQELPSARGCTYLLPKAHYGIGLKIGQSNGDDPAIRQAKKYLGFTDEELALLNEGVLRALEGGPLDPKELREKLGERVRSLGEEGKKRGLSTTLSLSLGNLQSRGLIRRIPMEARLDAERFRYAKWSDGPFAAGDPDRNDVQREMARLYWNWTGGASLAEFRWFTGFGVGESKRLAGELGLVPIHEDTLALPEDANAFARFEPSTKPQVRLLASIDSLILLRRNVASLLHESDRALTLPNAKGMANAGGLTDIDSHGIFDRGRWIGLWEFDPEYGEIAYYTFHRPTSPVIDEIARTLAMIAAELGDFRSFSLDSPKSRSPRIRQLRELQIRIHG